MTGQEWKEIFFICCTLIHEHLNGNTPMNPSDFGRISDLRTEAIQKGKVDPVIVAKDDKIFFEHFYGKATI